MRWLKIVNGNWEILVIDRLNKLKNVRKLMKKVVFVFGLLVLSLMSCTEKSNHEKIMELLNDLSTELMSCTTQEKYDVVYAKVIAIQHDPKFKAVEGVTNEQKIEITYKKYSYCMNYIINKSPNATKKCCKSNIF